MLGSLIGYEVGVRKGRWLLDHPGRLEKSRLKLLAKGDRAFGRQRGITVDHVTVYRWVQTFTGEFIAAARPARHATGGRWFVDET